MCVCVCVCVCSRKTLRERARAREREREREQREGEKFPLLSWRTLRRSLTSDDGTSVSACSAVASGAPQLPAHLNRGDTHHG